jgi:hypothetical protein
VIRDNESIMFAVKPDMSINVVVIPERKSEFDHIKNINDLIIYFKRLTNKSEDKNIVE